MKPDGTDVKRLTTFEDYDVRWPALGEGKIVYQHKMDIWLYELTSGRNAQVPIQLPSDRLQVREKFVDPKGTLQSWALAKDGERIALEARGDIFVARTQKKGLIRRITVSSSARSKFPAFSPGGTNIATWTEVNGEEQLLLHAADAATPPTQIGTTSAGWHYGAAWSPDGKSLARGDEKYQLCVTDTATSQTVTLDRGDWEITRYTWSPDSRYLAYDLQLWVCDACRGRAAPCCISSHQSHIEFPVALAGRAPDAAGVSDSRRAGGSGSRAGGARHPWADSGATAGVPFPRRPAGRASRRGRVPLGVCHGFNCQPQTLQFLDQHTE